MRDDTKTGERKGTEKKMKVTCYICFTRFYEFALGMYTVCQKQGRKKNLNEYVRRRKGVSFLGDVLSLRMLDRN